MKINEFLKEDSHEASMARAELLQIAKNAIAVAKLIQEGDDLPGWISSYITVANDHMNSVQEYMEYNGTDELAEDATGGATSSGSIATTPGVGTGANVGTLFGGTYKQKKTKRTK